MTLATADRTAFAFVPLDRRSRPGAPTAAYGATAYDLVKSGEDRYRLTLPVPGFAAEELEIETRDGELVVRGTPKPADEAETVLHRGIERGAFARRFALGAHVRVEGARLADGLLAITLVRAVPERLRPRPIAIDKAA
ncbi:MAG: Hsp20 family protein [Alphaproteobacteria bacterium]